MLVLERCLGERIIIRVDDRLIIVSVEMVNSEKTRLGIAADLAVEIHREEVWERIYGPVGAEADHV